MLHLTATEAGAVSLSRERSGVLRYSYRRGDFVLADIPALMNQRQRSKPEGRDGAGGSVYESVIALGRGAQAANSLIPKLRRRKVTHVRVDHGEALFGEEQAVVGFEILNVAA